MNFINSVRLHELMAEALGDDLVYSVALDEGKYYLAVSVHKSKRVEYKHGRNIQSCLIDTKDIGVDVEKLAEKIIPLYQEILVERTTDVEVNK